MKGSDVFFCQQCRCAQAYMPSSINKWWHALDLLLVMCNTSKHEGLTALGDSYESPRPSNLAKDNNFYFFETVVVYPVTYLCKLPKTYLLVSLNDHLCVVLSNGVFLY